VSRVSTWHFASYQSRTAIHAKDVCPGLRMDSGVGSTKGSIQLSKEAAEAGADFAIVIPSGYYAGALGREALKQYFVDVAEASPIPVMVYNCKFESVKWSVGCLRETAKLTCVVRLDSPWCCGRDRHGFGSDHRYRQGLIQHLRSQAYVSFDISADHVLIINRSELIFATIIVLITVAELSESSLGSRLRRHQTSSSETTPEGTPRHRESARKTSITRLSFFVLTRSPRLPVRQVLDSRWICRLYAPYCPRRQGPRCHHGFGQRLSPRPRRTLLRIRRPAQRDPSSFFGRDDPSPRSRLRGRLGVRRSWDRGDKVLPATDQGLRRSLSVADLAFPRGQGGQAFEGRPSQPVYGGREEVGGSSQGVEGERIDERSLGQVIQAKGDERSFLFFLLYGVRYGSVWIDPRAPGLEVVLYK
jgi:hypothetical protein